MKRILWALFAVLLTGLGCATIKDKQVTLVGEKSIYHGMLRYDGPYSGVIRMVSGPNGESFTGRYTVVDKTSTSSSSGNIIIPNGDPIPTMGSVHGSSSGGIDAKGYWYAAGSNGATMKCEVSAGIQGHGKGVCLHSNGTTYEILL